jgi:hypothetical protein
VPPELPFVVVVVMVEVVAAVEVVVAGAVEVVELVDVVDVGGWPVAVVVWFEAVPYAAAPVPPEVVWSSFPHPSAPAAASATTAIAARARGAPLTRWGRAAAGAGRSKGSR